MIDEIITLMEELVNERTVPRNVRAKIEEAINNLKDENKDLETRIGTVIATMDEISNDPNLPVYARTKVWNIVSRLEAARSQNK